MMAPHLGGRPGSSRQVRLMPVRQSGMDHRAVARIVLALARQMAADEAVEAAADDAVSSGAEVCAGRESGPSDVSAAARDDAVAPWAGAHSGQSARGVASVGRCAAEKFVSASRSGCSAGRCAHQRHDGAHHSPHENAAPFSALGGTP